MTATVEFIFDFASPNAYLVHHALDGFKARTGAEVQLVPCLLGGIFKATGNQAPMLAFADIPAKLAYENLEMNRFIAKHNITNFKMNPHFPVNTLLLMRGAIAAQNMGQFDAYVEAGLRFMWEDGLKMDDPEVYAKAFQEAGFDGAQLREATQDPEVKAKLVSNTEAAVQRGVFGIPTFILGDDIFFGKERLGQIEEMLTAS